MICCLLIMVRTKRKQRGETDRKQWSIIRNKSMFQLQQFGRPEMDSQRYRIFMHYQASNSTLIALRKGYNYDDPTTFSIARLFEFEWTHQESISYRIDLSFPIDVVRTDSGYFFLQFANMVVVVQGGRSMSLPIPKTLFMHSKLEHGKEMIHCLSRDTQYIIDGATLCYEQHRLRSPLPWRLCLQRVTVSAPKTDCIYAFENNAAGNSMNIYKYSTAEMKCTFISPMVEGMNIHHTACNGDESGIILYSE
ncbi:MAG: hypothetical protein HRU26_07130, partial [Psychroserpens sp.]|nr:hypothetical protein [Psychroserpens sp.]